jgi:hypothetical protein
MEPCAHKVLVTAITAIATLASITPANAQFLPRLQARTPAEYDAYLDVFEASGARQEAEARHFLLAYPKSDLRLPLFELLAKAS